jgi:hypothetical protein
MGYSAADILGLAPVSRSTRDRGLVRKNLFLSIVGRRGSNRLHINIHVRGRIKQKKKGRPKPSLHMMEITI